MLLVIIFIIITRIILTNILVRDNVDERDDAGRVMLAVIQRTVIMITMLIHDNNDQTWIDDH